MSARRAELALIIGVLVVVIVPGIVVALMGLDWAAVAP
jgi:hypothetical protein